MNDDPVQAAKGIISTTPLMTRCCSLCLISYVIETHSTLMILKFFGKQMMFL